MARIPDKEVQRLKDEVAVQRLVEAAGVELRKSGKAWIGKCPFHDDSEPSLVVAPAKNLWHCFGFRRARCTEVPATSMDKFGSATRCATALSRTTVRGSRTPMTLGDLEFGRCAW